MLITRKPLNVSIIRIDGQSSHSISSVTIQADISLGRNEIGRQLQISPMGAIVIPIGTGHADATGKVTITIQNESGRCVVIRGGLPVEVAGTFQRIDIPYRAPAFFPEGQCTSIDDNTLEIATHRISTASGIDGGITIDGQIAVNRNITALIKVELPTIQNNGGTARTDIFATQGDVGRIGEVQVRTLCEVYIPADGKRRPGVTEYGEGRTGTNRQIAVYRNTVKSVFPYD